jgi:hypothetical protein
MAGLVPAIHAFAAQTRKQGVDHRDKRGDDDFYADAIWIASEGSSCPTGKIRMRVMCDLPVAPICRKASYCRLPQISGISPPSRAR